MTRMERKNNDFEYMGRGGITDAFDDMIKQIWRVDNEQLDHICSTATDEELQALTPPLETWEAKRKALQILSKYIK